MTAQPGEPLASINAELAKKRQMLAFEPPDWRALLGAQGEPTLGGVIACNLAGPRRVRAGSARDYILGFSAVNGFGEIWKAGGKVVKNVTGYDMCKLQAGAYGTLSALTEITHQNHAETGDRVHRSSCMVSPMTSRSQRWRMR